MEEEENWTIVQNKAGERRLHCSAQLNHYRSIVGENNEVQSGYYNSDGVLAQGDNSNDTKGSGNVLLIRSNDNLGGIFACICAGEVDNKVFPGTRYFISV